MDTIGDLYKMKKDIQAALCHQGDKVPTAVNIWLWPLCHLLPAGEADFYQQR